MAFGLFNALPAQAYDEEKQNTGTTTGLPLPRFASMKSSNINARSGPGDNYPIKAVYKRAGLPVQIVSEFKLWREIEDMEGERNWVHRAMLSGNRSAILNEDAYAYSGKSNSAPVAKLEKDAQIWIEECELSYCRMRLGGIKGWVSKASLWGVYPNEIFD
jgi:SH3-like domain-containing protein